LVAESASLQKLEKARSTLRNNQIDYYFLKTREGGFKLLTGAFITKKRAETLVQEIMTLGYDAKVVLR
jgi:cell division protein FtsN